MPSNQMPSPTLLHAVETNCKMFGDSWVDCFWVIPQLVHVDPVFALLYGISLTTQWTILNKCFSNFYSTVEHIYVLIPNLGKFGE